MTPLLEEILNSMFLVGIMLVYHFVVTPSQDTVTPPQDTVAPTQGTVTPTQDTVAIGTSFKSGVFKSDMTTVIDVKGEVTILNVSTMSRTKTLIARTSDVLMIYNNQSMRKKFLQLIASHSLIRNDNLSYDLVYDKDFNKFLA